MSLRNGGKHCVRSGACRHSWMANSSLPSLAQHAGGLPRRTAGGPAPTTPSMAGPSAQPAACSTACRAALLAGARSKLVPAAYSVLHHIQVPLHVLQISCYATSWVLPQLLPVVGVGWQHHHRGTHGPCVQCRAWHCLCCGFLRHHQIQASLNYQVPYFSGLFSQGSRQTEAAVLEASVSNLHTDLLTEGRLQCGAESSSFKATCTKILHVPIPVSHVRKY